MPAKRKRLETDTAKKRARQDIEKKRSASRVNVGEQMERWLEVKNRHHLASHTKTAEFLLNCYDKYNRMLSSTPASRTSVTLMPPPLSSVSERAESDVSGVKVISTSEIEEDVPSTHRAPNLQASAATDVVHLIKQHIATQDSTTTSDSDYGDYYKYDTSYRPEEDEDYEEECDSGDLSEHAEEEDDPEINLDMDVSKIGDEILIVDSDDDPNESDDDTIIYDYKVPGVQKVVDVRSTVQEECTIAYQSCLYTLANHAPQKPCDTCQEPYIITWKKNGTAVYMTWTCSEGHLGFRWCSQPRVKAKGVLVGNFMLAVNTLLSGNNYSKVALLAKFTNLGVPDRCLYDQLQALYCAPIIEELWMKTMKQVHNKYKDRPIVIAADGRNDSPGHCAQYCTYTIMEHDSKDILEMVIIDKRETAMKSTNMEKLALQRGLQSLQSRGLKVVELVTDAHAQIAKMMKDDHPDVFHSWDVWHGSKNIGKHLTSAASEKSCSEIRAWVKDIVNHFWFCAKNCQGSLEQFIALWRSTLHHVVNDHDWGLGKCEHDDLSEAERNKPWIEVESAAHTKLRLVLLSKRLLNTLGHYVNFRHTGTLENLQNHILMYASKRFSFRPPAYRARNRLAGIDYQFHKDRPNFKKKDGTEKYKRTYSKRSEKHSVTAVKVAKTYPYINDLHISMMKAHIDDKEPLKRKRKLAADDPRKISKTLSKNPPPPTTELVKAKRSRFGDTSEAQQPKPSNP